eukprot:XP_010646597.1 PREDICTED: ferritin-2, chloroplastic-like [Vitis vinifera]
MAGLLLSGLTLSHGLEVKMDCLLVSICPPVPFTHLKFSSPYETTINEQISVECNVCNAYPTRYAYYVEIILLSRLLLNFARNLVQRKESNAEKLMKYQNIHAGKVKLRVVTRLLFALSSANSAIYDTLCRRLVGICNAVIMSLNYRRASENPYPCPYDDGWAALKWLNSKPWLRSEDGLSPRLNLSSSSFHPSEVL